MDPPQYIPKAPEQIRLRKVHFWLKEHADGKWSAGPTSPQESASTLLFHFKAPNEPHAKQVVRNLAIGQGVRALFK